MTTTDGAIPEDGQERRGCGTAATVCLILGINLPLAGAYVLRIHPLLSFGGMTGLLCLGFWFSMRRDASREDDDPAIGVQDLAASLERDQGLLPVAVPSRYENGRSPLEDLPDLRDAEEAKRREVGTVVERQDVDSGFEHPLDRGQVVGLRHPEEPGGLADDPGDAADPEPIEVHHGPVEEVSPSYPLEGAALGAVRMLPEHVVVPGDADDPPEPRGEGPPDVTHVVRPPLGELGVGVEVTAEDHSHARRRGQAALPAPAFQRLRHLAAEEAKGSVRPGLSGLPPLQVGGDHQGIEPVGQPVHGAAEDGEVALDGRPTPSGVQVPDPVPRLHLDA
ncbi:MAG: hypothetical protein HUU06_04065 [Planctomycetaceae bacterium]|nr:hypothetical protein [Planctomycetaceae bacterium]